LNLLKLNTFQKILLGIATVFHAVFPVMILAFWGPILWGLHSGQTSLMPNLLFAEIYGVSLCIFIPLQFILLIVYMLHIFQNISLSDSARVMWVMAIFILPFVINPVYYYLFIFRVNTQRSTSPASG
jgi:uncharacterized membrane protein YhdT